MTSANCRCELTLEPVDFGAGRQPTGPQRVDDLSYLGVPYRGTVERNLVNDGLPDDFLEDSVCWKVREPLGVANMLLDRGVYTLRYSRFVQRDGSPATFGILS